MDKNKKELELELKERKTEDLIKELYDCGLSKPRESVDPLPDKRMTIEEYIEYSRKLNGGHPTYLIGQNGYRVELTVELFKELQERAEKYFQDQDAKIK